MRKIQNTHELVVAQIHSQGQPEEKEREIKANDLL
jgi:hypothetical protein